MQIGLLGKANVGKSTFFSAATEVAVPSGNFPFTTIEPNVGVAHVETRCACAHFGIEHQNDLCRDGTRLVPVRLIDVAGLVPGAHEGKGLGNKFLDNARQAEILIHVVDAAGTTDIQGQPVAAGTHDPAEDVRFVRDEFDLWFADILMRDWDRIIREVGQKRTKLADGIAERFSGLGITASDVHRVLAGMNLEGRGPAEWSESDTTSFARRLRADAKPMIIAANKADLCGGGIRGATAALAGASDGSRVVPCSAETELLLRKAAKAGVITYAPGAGSFEVAPGAADKLAPQQRKALDMAAAILSRISDTGVQKLLDTAVFEILGYIVVYPVEDETRLTNKDGQVLPDSRLVPRGSTVRDLAASVHADLAEGLLHAIDCKTKQRISGDKQLSDGDVIKIVSTMSRG